MKVSTDWFRSRPISDDIMQIDEPHTDPLVASNIWHIRGSDRDLVFDTGLGVASLRAHLPHLFERDPIVVLSHAHFDHVGGAWEFPTCWAHRSEPFDQSEPASLNGPAALASIGLDATDVAFRVADLLIDAIPYEGFEPAEYAIREAPIDRWLVEGDAIDLGSRSFRVLHLPGHTPGSIALYDEHDGTLFSGDVLYDGELLDDCTGANVGDYIVSLQRLRDLPASQVHAGHGDTFDHEHKQRLVEAYLALADPSTPVSSDID